VQQRAKQEEEIRLREEEIKRREEELNRREAEARRAEEERRRKEEEEKRRKEEEYRKRADEEKRKQQYSLNINNTPPGSASASSGVTWSSLYHGGFMPSRISASSQAQLAEMRREKEQNRLAIERRSHTPANERNEDQKLGPKSTHFSVRDLFS
jgi:hypothetical protein